jgi:ribosomal protein S27AE
MKLSLYKSKRNINNLGLGYCSGCGKLVKLEKTKDKWICKGCGYANVRIFDHNYKR